MNRKALGRDSWNRIFGGMLCSIGLQGMSATLLYANGPEIGRDAGMIFPLNTHHVQLVSEQVKVVLPASAASDPPGFANCVYELKNLSDRDADFEMAFAMNPHYVSGSDYRRAGIQVRSRDREIPFRLEPLDKKRWFDLVDSPPDSFPVWQMHLSPLETVRLHLRYEITWSGGSDGETSGMNFTYWAKSASLWAGVIEKARVVFDLPDPLGPLLQCAKANKCVEILIEPAGYVLKASRLQWDFSDWEPSTNIRIAVTWKVEAE